MNLSDKLARELEKQVAESAEVKRRLLAEPMSVVTIAELLIQTYASGGSMILFGNGGSAADAQHIAAELVGRFSLERRALPATALTVNTSILTALANDYSYETIFARQIEAIGRPGDVAVGISTSGNAANVIEGLRVARLAGLRTVAMTGRGGGKAREMAEFWVAVPSDEIPRIQESHILIGHFWCHAVESVLFEDGSDLDRIP